MATRMTVLAMVAVAVFMWASKAMAEEPAAPDLDAQVKQLQDTVAVLQGQIADVQAKVEKQKALTEALKELGYNPDPMDLRLYWKDGIRMDSRDGSVKLKFGGRLQYDLDWQGSNSVEPLVGEVADGFQTRRARIYVSGDFGKNVGFKWEYDLATGAAVARDVYIELRQLPVVGNLRIGHYREPFSLDELTSSNYITFMERALPNILTPAFNGGAMLYNSALDDRVTWAAGIFRDTNQADGAQAVVDGQYAFTTRVTGLPWYEDGGKRLFHLGTSFSVRHTDGNVRYRARPEDNLAPFFIDTGNYFTRDICLYGTEGALVLGPFHAEAEYIAANMAADNNVARAGNQPDPDYHGYYVQAGYFLTGETRPYKKSEGIFDRVKPLKPYTQGGPGAWEVAGRFSYLDLDDDRIDGGKLWDYTLGLNWYLNNNVRLMWNYIRSRVDVGPGADTRASADIFMMRAQVDF
ncbi:MAG TPA: porin [Phycisphaerae bacterium]|nr:porin [Phycisphaerae bacterium]